jgi:hypothetical protein
MRVVFGGPYAHYENYYIIVAGASSYIYFELREDADIDVFQADATQAEWRAAHSTSGATSRPSPPWPTRSASSQRGPCVAAASAMSFLK